MVTLKKAVFLAVFPAVFSGCSSIMMFHGAKTVPKGSVQAGLGAGGGSYSSRHTLANFDLTMPSLAGNLWLRYGITRWMDAGFNMAVPGNMTADAKLRFLSEESGAPLTASTGFGYGFSAGESDKESGREQRVSDCIVPLYLSRDLGNWFTVYAVPRYVYRRTFNENRTVNPAVSERLYDDMWGVGLGLMLNFTEKKTKRLIVECQRTGAFRSGDIPSFQCGLGLSADWDLFGP
jgi:hypothetical protein